MQEILSFVTGMDIKQRGVTEVEVDNGIRGGSFEQTLILLYWSLDMLADYNRMGKLGFFAEASNINNTEYIEAGTVQMTERCYRAGFLLNFD